jgi:uncharacterized repeat protein (TIGR01451 family)
MNVLQRFVAAALLLLLAAFGTVSHAAAPAGLQIGNQASATYSDGSAVTRTVTSNTVLTTVQQVASLSLAASSAKTISAGGQVYYPHTLVNTGNGPDSFALTSGNTGSFVFTSVLFYADVNGDGVPDSAVPITGTGALAMGQAFKFVVAGIVPPTAVSGNTNALVVTAASAFTPATTAAVTDTTTVTGQAVVGVTQALDVGSGASPSTGRTITVTYTNTGNTTATGLLLTEVLPSGMTYVAGSARWSVTGSGTVLTDANAADDQSGIVYDFGATVAGRVTATIASIAPGASGTLSFKVDINAGLPAGANAATAATVRFGYHDGASPVAASNGNTVQYTVQASAAVTFSGATVAQATQGGTVSFTDTVTNTGNAADSFDITVGSSSFPAGTTFQFFQAGGVTPLLDTNGNQTPDSGPLAPGASVGIVVKAVLPPAATGGPYSMQAVATSKLDTGAHANATNTLQAVNGNSVDLTNDTAGPAAPGYGAGPEPTPAASPTVSPGGTTRFTLVVANGSSVADTFKLQASTDPTFATVALPVGWTLEFKNTSGATIDNTGTIASGSNRTVYADVTVPAGALAGATQLYFRVASPTTGASDRLHDAVIVGLLRSLALTPNHTGQATASGTVVYTHMLVNGGSTLEGDGVASTVTLTTSDSVAGFTSIVYWDKNNNGTLDPTDPAVTDTSSLTGGSNGASTAAGLDAGESVRLFVKVTTPASATSGAGNVTTLTATTTGTIGALPAPAAAAATDGTAVIASHVTLVITQALDAACDGTADTVFTPNPITLGGAPGGCVRYEVTATNAGPVAVSSLVISNATPAYTTYTSTVAASATAGSVTAPADGAAGSVQTTVASLAPGATVVLRFGVRIAP